MRVLRQVTGYTLIALATIINWVVHLALIVGGIAAIIWNFINNGFLWGLLGIVLIAVVDALLNWLVRALLLLITAPLSIGGYKLVKMDEGYYLNQRLDKLSKRTQGKYPSLDKMITEIKSDISNEKQ